MSRTSTSPLSCVLACALAWGAIPSLLGCPEPPFADCDGDGIEDGEDDCLACDRDQDGFDECGEDGEIVDCNDSDEDVFPGAAEVICDGDDQDCDPSTSDTPDGDGDGFNVCDGDPDGGDCDDSDPAVYPGADEECDGVDTDCDGELGDDEKDADEDGYLVCGGLAGDPDCDDLDPYTYPGADELCDEIDNDCDGAPAADEVDGDGDGFLGCDDCDDADPDSYPGATELCDGVDNDCDGGLPAEEEDADADGVAACDGDCDDTEATVYPGAPELCDDLDNDCDPGTVEDVDADGDGYELCDGDCDDTDPEVHPGVLELCDGIDNDCDGQLGPDEQDADGDGQAVCQGDCDDSDPTAYIGAQEICDGVDNDCIDGIDNGMDEDADGDGYTGCGSDGLPGNLDGDEDCDDDNIRVFPGAPELCDGVLNDCDGTLPADEADDDGDGWPVCAGDCDDTEPNVTPVGHDDTTDGLDNDCDGAIDNGVPCDGRVPADYPTIGDAIAAADHADRICVASGTYVETVNFGGKTLEVVGVAGPRSTVIDAGGADSAVEFHNLETSTSLLEGFAVTGGSLHGLYITGETTPTLRQLHIRDNAEAGVYVSHLDGALELEDIVVEDNATGISLSWSFNVYIDNAVIAGNGPGAGVSLDMSGLGISHAALVRNSAYGMYLSRGYVTITNALVAKNKAGWNEASCGICATNVQHSELFASNLAVIDNSTYGSGTGIEITNGSFSVTNVTATDNAGTGIWVGAAPGTVTYCNLHGNDDGGSHVGAYGNVDEMPYFENMDHPDPLLWDLHISQGSPLVNAGSTDAAYNDPDASRSDIGMYGGPEADGWDLDGDGDPVWWQPGTYDPATYPALGYDCDDLNPGVSASTGC